MIAVTLLWLVLYSPHFDGWSNLLLVLFLPNLDRVWYKLTWTFLSYWLALIFILNIVALFYEWFLNVLQLLPLDLFGFVGSLYKMVASVVLEKKNLKYFCKILTLLGSSSDPSGYNLNAYSKSLYTLTLYWKYFICIIK